MKVAQIKSQRQFNVQNWRQYHIQSYGDTNDFPQSVDEIVTASKTGNACLGIYGDFIYGQGFKDSSIGKIIANAQGHTMDKVLRMVAKDFAKWHGFAIHVNYNANFRIRSISHFPFETLRLHTPEDNGDVLTVAYHPDWGRRNKLRGRGRHLTLSGLTSSTLTRMKYLDRLNEQGDGITTKVKCCMFLVILKVPQATHSPYT